jgi:hypothetical protein
MYVFLSICEGRRMIFLSCADVVCILLACRLRFLLL